LLNTCGIALNIAKVCLVRLVERRTVASELQGWSGASGELAEHALQESERTLQAYRTQPTPVQEHVGIEANIFPVVMAVGRSSSSFRTPRMRFSLAANLAAWRSSSRKLRSTARTRGRPSTRMVSLPFCSLTFLRSERHRLALRISFESVLNVTSTPQFFCRAGSFCFDLDRSRAYIRAVLPNVEQVPSCGSRT
jgi:hypothetical protein